MSPTSGKNVFEERINKVLGIEHIEQATEVASARQLKAFQIVAPVYFQIRNSLGIEHPSVEQLYESLEWLVIGYHRSLKPEKDEAYRYARDLVSQAVCFLVFDKS